jgi:predicted metalloprotease
MASVSHRLVRSIRILLVVAIASARLAAASSAQEMATPGISGNSYTSPEFGYTFSWDESFWSGGDETSEDGYDSVHLESETSDLYVEGLYFYRGDPGDCIDGERTSIAQDDGLDALDPLVDDNGTPIAGSDQGETFGFFAYPEQADDGSTVDGVVYLDCRTLIPNSAVLVITAFFDAADLDAQAAAVDDVLGSLTLAIGAPISLDASDIEQIARLSENDIDAYWSGVFADLGETYVNPKFITFTGPVETACGEETSGESGPFYCDGDGTVYLDIDYFTSEILPFGVLVMQVVIAHEIGHHVQALLGLTGCTATACGEPGSNLAIELQADCFAGAWTQDAAQRDVIQTSDVKRVDVATKTYFGDPPDTPNDATDAHGSGQARDAMFDAGYTDGLAACGLQ